MSFLLLLLRKLILHWAFSHGAPFRCSPMARLKVLTRLSRLGVPRWTTKRKVGWGAQKESGPQIGFISLKPKSVNGSLRISFRVMGVGFENAGVWLLDSCARKGNKITADGLASWPRPWIDEH